MPLNDLGQETTIFIGQETIFIKNNLLQALYTK